jgi:hypothetical protein
MYNQVSLPFTFDDGILRTSLLVRPTSYQGIAYGLFSAVYSIGRCYSEVELGACNHCSCANILLNDVCWSWYQAARLTQARIAKSIKT